MGLSSEAKEGLLFPYADWASRIATLRFVQDIPLGAWHPSYPELGRIDDALAGLADRPMLILWGNDDFCFTTAFRDEWARRFPQARLVSWDDVGHYVMEDAPDRVVAELDRFLP
jgi:haloalkane dehalogenase